MSMDAGSSSGARHYFLLQYFVYASSESSVEPAYLH